MEKQISSSHLEFIRLVSSGRTQQEAYRVSIGKKGVRSNVCDVKGSQLARKYAKEIAQARDKSQKVIEQANNTKESINAQNEILENASKIVDQLKADAKAFRILTDDDMVDDIIVVGENHFPIKRKPTQKEIQDSYKAYNLRFGSNAPAKTDITSGGQVLGMESILYQTKRREPND